RVSRTLLNSSTQTRSGCADGPIKCVMRFSSDSAERVVLGAVNSPAILQCFIRKSNWYDQREVGETPDYSLSRRAGFFSSLVVAISAIVITVLAVIIAVLAVIIAVLALVKLARIVAAHS